MYSGAILYVSHTLDSAVKADVDTPIVLVSDSPVWFKRVAMDKHSSLFVRRFSKKEKNVIILTPGANPIKLFTVIIYKFSPKRCFTRVGSGLTRKHETKLVRLARDKCSSLLRKFVNYGRKKFYRIGSWGQRYESFFFVADKEVI
jgi:hypothetical protein